MLSITLGLGLKKHFIVFLMKNFQFCSNHVSVTYKPGDELIQQTSILENSSHSAFIRLFTEEELEFRMPVGRMYNAVKESGCKGLGNGSSGGEK